MTNGPLKDTEITGWSPWVEPVLRCDRSTDSGHFSQEVCPFTRKFSRVANDPDYAARSAWEAEWGWDPSDPDDEGPTEAVIPTTDGPALVDLMRMSEDEWDAYMRGSAMRRAGYSVLRRNVAIAVGNWLAGSATPDLEAVGELVAALSDEDPVVSEAAAWGLRRFAKGADTPSPIDGGGPTSTRLLCPKGGQMVVRTSGGQFTQARMVGGPWASIPLRTQVCFCGGPAGSSHPPPKPPKYWSPPKKYWSTARYENSRKTLKPYGSFVYRVGASGLICGRMPSAPALDPLARQWMDLTEAAVAHRVEPTVLVRG